MATQINNLDKVVLKNYPVQGLALEWKATMLYEARVNYVSSADKNIGPIHFVNFWRIREELMNEIREFEALTQTGYENLISTIPDNIIKPNGKGQFTDWFTQVKKSLAKRSAVTQPRY